MQVSHLCMQVSYMHAGELHACRWVTCMQVSFMHAGELHACRWVTCMQMSYMHAGLLHACRWVICMLVSHLCMQVSYMHAGELHACRWVTCIQVSYMHAGELYACRWVTCMQVSYMHAGELHACRWVTCMQVSYMHASELHSCRWVICMLVSYMHAGELYACRWVTCMQVSFRHAGEFLWKPQWGCFFSRVYRVSHQSKRATARLQVSFFGSLSEAVFFQSLQSKPSVKTCDCCAAGEVLWKLQWGCFCCFLNTSVDSVKLLLVPHCLRKAFFELAWILRWLSQSLLAWWNAGFGLQNSSSCSASKWFCALFLYISVPLWLFFSAFLCLLSYFFSLLEL
jgi:hypothetical protein